MVKTLQRTIKKFKSQNKHHLHVKQNPGHSQKRTNSEKKKTNQGQIECKLDNHVHIEFHYKF